MAVEGKDFEVPGVLPMDRPFPCSSVTNNVAGLLHLAGAVAAFDTLRRGEAKADVVACNAMLEAFLRNGALSDALRLLGNMRVGTCPALGSDLPAPDARADVACPTPQIAKRSARVVEREKMKRESGAGEQQRTGTRDVTRLGRARIDLMCVM